MMIMTILQRGIGFVRGIWFCRLLDSATLGQWAMGFGFLSLVTPMLLFGLPGSLPRFIQHYLGKGQLRGFLARMLAGTAAVSLLGVAAMLLLPGWFGGLIFGQQNALALIAGLAIAFVGVILFNVTNEITAGLRLVRVGSIAQFVQSVAFTLLGVAWLWRGGGVAGLLAIFAIACVLGALPAWWALIRGWGTVSRSQQRIDGVGMWRRIIPYAAALWAMNLLSNAFELADRYMLLHFSGSTAEAGQSALGQYHSGLIIPCLFISLANMISSVLTPYLVTNWERADHQAVYRRLGNTLILTSLGFTLAAALTLPCCPWIFNGLLEGRYDGGLNVLPICFLSCIWFATSTLAQCYLWVAERGKWVSAVMAAGLATNIGLNMLLIPRIGLEGAVWGTCLSHLVVVVGMWIALSRGGYPIDAANVWITLVPATLLAGWIPAVICVLVAIIASADLRGLATESLMGLRRYGGGLSFSGYR
jgi:O-antigen/teichoic acid export membrane protein